MNQTIRGSFTWLMVAFLLLAAKGLTNRALAQETTAIKYVIRILPQNQSIAVQVSIPTEELDSIELMMPVWTPGYYKLQDYTEPMTNFSAKSFDGTELKFSQSEKNRWQIETKNEKTVYVRYDLKCDRGSVISNEVTEKYAALNGCATFLNLVNEEPRPIDVQLVLPEGWSKIATALQQVSNTEHHFRAVDFDELVDSPIVAGQLSVREFDVKGSTHYWVDVGESGNWDAEVAIAKIRKIVQENDRFWGGLPFEHYYFLNVFRRGGGGLEHKNSTLLTASQSVNHRWLQFICHEYFHAFNVKRLRPIQLGPFDYQHGPRTDGLWIAEGLTNYYGDLLVARASLTNANEYLRSMSNYIDELQNTPGRLKQSLADASLNVWGSAGASGVGVNREHSVSYYTKGPVVGFLLDAKIRQQTRGAKNLDDVMRLAYKKFSGTRGFRAEEFLACAEQVSGTNLDKWFAKAIYSKDELDYQPALDWYGLKFASPKGEQSSWRLEIRPGASETQIENLKSLLAGSEFE